MLLRIPLLAIASGFWERVDRTRAPIIRRRHKARLVDALAAQPCIDSKVALKARDQDFCAFSRHCSLELVLTWTQ
jgi:hypothetical protein